ncbi:MAG: hypothetical protein A4E41_00042 [Methanoregulaceae archaeon PtaU1.Bin066]|nr:MAG: hypothetical protein A4E41_00042 [Methanoregulaceae archaeon PtaU1.Bin066]
MIPRSSDDAQRKEEIMIFPVSRSALWSKSPRGRSVSGSPHIILAVLTAEPSEN